MPRIIGRMTKIGLGKETTRGTAVAPTFWIPVRELGFDDRTEMVDNESGYGHIASVSDSHVIKEYADGDYEGKIFDKSVGIELTNVFGQSPVSTQRASSGVYDHVYTLLNSNQHKSLTAVVSEANYTGRYPLAMFDSWEFEAEVGDYVKRTVNIVSNKSTSSADVASYLATENEFLPKHMAVKLASVAADMDAASSAKMRRIQFEIAKNVDDEQQVLGNNGLDDVPNTNLEIEGEFEAYYDARTYHTTAAAGTHQALRIEMENTDVDLGSGHHPALRFDFSDIVFSFPEKDFDNNDTVLVTVAFKGTLNLTAGTIISARLTNAYAGTNY